MSSLPEGLTESDVRLALRELDNSPDLTALAGHLCSGKSTYMAAKLVFESGDSSRSFYCLEDHAVRLRRRLLSYYRKPVEDAIRDLEQTGSVAIEPAFTEFLREECKSRGIRIKEKTLVVLE